MDKFKAWDTENNRMVYLGSIIDICNSSDMGLYNVEDWEDTMYLEKCIIIQSTGYTDDDKNDIYNGDIIQNGNGIWLEIYWNKELCQFRQRVCNRTNVEMLGYEWQFDKRTDMDLRFNYKTIIGNRFKNPELIEI